MKTLLNLLKIKSLTTLIVTISFVILCFTGNIPEELSNAFLIIIGFYFGTQATKE